MELYSISDFTSGFFGSKIMVVRIIRVAAGSKNLFICIPIYYIVYGKNYYLFMEIWAIFTFGQL